MRSGEVLAVSALAHCALFAVLARWVARPGPVMVPPAERAPLTYIEIEPMAVTLVEAGPGPPGPTGIGSTRAASLTSSTHVPSATRLPGPAPEPGPAPGPRPEAPHGPGMHMRPEAMRGGPATGADGLDRIAAAGKPLPEPVHESGRVESAPGGRAVIHDTVTTIEVDRDGTAHFHDKPDVDFHFSPLLHAFGSVDNLRHGLGELIDNWYADPYATARGGRFEDLPPDQKAIPGGCDQWGECHVASQTAPAPMASAPIGGGKFDITDMLYRKFVGDPYASRKRKALDVTIDERAVRGGAYRVDQLDRSAELMHRNLVKLWVNVTDPAERREALFELWDECGEGEGPLGEAGERARTEVIGWIRAHAVTYAPDEADRLNARRSSKQPFAP